jgi:hypothetical protein
VEQELLSKSSAAPAESTDEVTSVASRRSSSGSHSVSSSTIPYVLTPGDKEQINRLYISLKPSDMWTLSTGKVVEKKMEELAKKCVVEQ